MSQTLANSPTRLFTLLPALLVAATLARRARPAVYWLQAPLRRWNSPPRVRRRSQSLRRDEAGARQAGRATAATSPTAAPKVEFEKYTLPNGLQVILHVDRKLPIVHVNQWFHVGSKNEKPGRTGFAHLFEHMMFQGSKNVPGEYFTIAEAGRRESAGGRRQRHDRQRPHQLLRDRAVGQSRGAALARVGSPGHAARRHRSEEARQPARRREERASSGPREPALRPLARHPVRSAVPEGPSLFVAGHRQHGGSERRLARRREGVLPPLLHAEQPLARDCRRLRSGAGEEAGREVLRPIPARSRARSAGALDSDADVERIVEVADRVPQERTYMVWPGPEYFGAGRRGAEHRLTDPDRRPVVAA